MPYQEPAPRYSRPIPPSKLPPVDTFLPLHRPLLDQAVHAARVIIRRERSDRMLRIGAALGILAALAVTAALASI